MQFFERRAFSRIEVNSQVRYRVQGEENFQEGTLEDASPSGVLLWTQHTDMPVGTKLLIVVEPEEGNQLPIEIEAMVVRSVAAIDTDRSGYGCQIEEITNA